MLVFRYSAEHDTENSTQKSMEVIMRKKLQKWIAIGLVVCMAGLSGCGGGSDQGSADSSQADAGTDETTVKETTQATDDSADDNSNEETSSTAPSLPLCEEKTTLTAFVAGSGNFTTGTFTENVITNNPAYKKIFEDTNVELDFIVPASGEEEAQFNLLVASGNYPDLIIGSG